MSVKLMPLEKVANIYSGSNLKNGRNVFGEGGCPWVKVEDLNNSEVEKTLRSLSPDGMKQAKVSPVHTVFFSATGTIGKVGIARVPMAPSNNMFAVEFDVRQIVPLYGMYCLLAMREIFRAEAGGAVYASLRLSVFRKIRIPVPDLKIQQNIAKKLTILCRSRMQQEQICKEMKEAVHDLFDQYFGETAKAAAYGPDAWLKLGEYADIVLNGAAKKKEGTFAHYISTSWLDDGEILYEQAPWTETDPEKAGPCSLHAGDIVMNRINSIQRLGKCGIVLEEPKKLTVFGQNTLRIRCRKQMLQPLFLFAWLTHPYIKQYIQSHAKNSTSFQSSLNKQVLLDIPVLQADLIKQKKYSEELEHYFRYIRTAEEIIKTLQELQQVWYDKICLLLQEGEGEEPADENVYKEGRYWVTPSGFACYYDSYLECIQVPGEESRTIRLSQLPVGVEIQFLEEIRTVQQSGYGALGHIRLKRIGSSTLEVITMVPTAYGAQEKKGEELEGQPEEDGILSEQQDFVYLRRIQETEFESDEIAEHFLAKYRICDREEYSRFWRLPDSVRRFVRRLSVFQQAVFEEFLLAMQPLACHMVGKQVALRSGKNKFQDRGIQDVISAVRLLEHAGLLERKQGLYLNYDEDYRQGEQRQMILDHRGRPVPIDTWVCADVEEQEAEDAADQGPD